MYGTAPYEVAVIHGGPGAAGGMAPVAKHLAKKRGVLEPLQTARSLEGQVEELKLLLEKNGTLPAILIGHSWGAWLSLIVAARHHEIVRKLILVGSGPFEDKYVEYIKRARFNRLSEDEKIEYESILDHINNPQILDKSPFFARLSELSKKTDSYDPIKLKAEEDTASILVDQPGEIFTSVWKDAAEFRSSGKLVEPAKDVNCPVVAIHGDYDSHPAEGVRKPLAEVIKDFRFILLEKCGHHPWEEKQARDGFFRILDNEIAIK